MLIPVKVLNIRDQHKTVKVSHSLMVIRAVSVSGPPCPGHTNEKTEPITLHSLPLIFLDKKKIGLRESWPCSVFKAATFCTIAKYL